MLNGANEGARSATARRRERKRERERLAAEAAAQPPPPPNEWTAHAHAAQQQREEWARHPQRRRVRTYGQWVRREERLQRRADVLREWAEAEQLADQDLPWFGGYQQVERRQHLLEAMAQELAARGHTPPTLESWLMARHPRTWIRIATHGASAAIVMGCGAMPLALVAACTATSGCEAAAHLACAAWAATVVWLRLARRRRALAAARERGSLQTGLVLHRGRRGVEQTVEHTAQVRCTCTGRCTGGVLIGT